MSTDQNDYFSMYTYFYGGYYQDKPDTHNVSVNIKVSKGIIISDLENCLYHFSGGGEFVSYKDVHQLGLALYFISDKLEILKDIDYNEAYETGIEMIRILEKIDTDDDCFPYSTIDSIKKILNIK